MNYQDTARQIIDRIGGKENVLSLFHCITRLRFLLKDNDKADRAALEALDGVMGVNISGDQFQLIIGNDVEPLCKALLAVLPDLDNAARPTKRRNPVSVVLEGLSSIFSPIIPAIAGAGILKGMLALMVAMQWVETTNQTYQILLAISDGVFYFMPLALSFSAAKKFGANPYVAVALAAVLFHPAIQTLFKAGAPVNFIGLPVPTVNYASTVIPILLAVWLLSRVERLIDRFMPGPLKTMFVPLLCLLIVTPITLIAIGPVGIYTGNALSGGIIWLVENMGIVAGVVVGGTLSLIIITGMHYVIVPIMINNISTMGFDPIKILFYIANLGQAGAAFGVFLRARDKKLKSLALTTSFSAMMGITEPAMYGVNIRYKRPFAAALAGGACGGAFAMAMGVKTYAFALSGLPGLPALVGPTFLWALVSIAISFVCAATLTVILGFEEAAQPVVAGVSPMPIARSEEKLFAPVSGELKALNTLSDPVFADEIFGKGLAIYPTTGELRSPVNGKVASVFETHHALALQSDTGAEILIHIGIDTVKLGGRHFTSHIEAGQFIEVGDLLVTFDLDALRAEGIDPSVILVVTNSECYGDISPVKANGDVASRDEFLTLTASAA
ncbi:MULTISPECIES: beta-glucoside-specific PTS transporter subunit IIABC [Phytobacter]|jgi:PTS system beta-glucosides-specific IIC component|uniref:PTS beta-glucoside transporter subunit IIA n=1 Tax=Phytobacter diazotrophicus TaxID=395631 RepID=A0ABM7VYF9_9ENTR|nr:MULTISPECIES: beta-glucoside-specific PTS transporter subunit IIABC [Phytobacter]MDU4152620.1 beta-glucoside-specific PTS transporter subunit IIABC [Enterobacteriaceae bacterium]PTA96652.1 PTS beta-glucoside transporter subunit EIIBCA [Kluyvera sp. Nf5]MDU4996361.1 beta-glucoside-specific PTS transporter subunit IIABC [Enterobacteriaceae bacterium]MDU7378433.1 beta-glucoside-specific PTS transporter subunit IIABC [Enterobacteriaceae bacterium]BBE78909.1 PTS beta-glucoside transporter subuni